MKGTNAKEDIQRSREKLKGADSAKGDSKCMRVIITSEGWKMWIFSLKRRNINRLRREIKSADRALGRK